MLSLSFFFCARIWYFKAGCGAISGLFFCLALSLRLVDDAFMKVALLTIGTEITSGEIVNTNAVWMSEQLESLGFNVAAQLSVPDESSLIQWSFSSLVEADCKLLFVTGGLGPTTDDITRQELAKWCGAELVFNDEVFARLSEVLAARGVPVREGHKQQCYFLKDSDLLPNSAGTALGFYVLAQGVHIFVMPGPPRELKPMWTDEVLPRLSQFPRDRDFGVKRWLLTGVPESEAAEVTEKVMKGCDVVLGYRASRPNVRVKVRFRLSDPVVASKLIELDRVLSKWVVPAGE